MYSKRDRMNCGVVEVVHYERMSKEEMITYKSRVDDV